MMQHAEEGVEWFDVVDANDRVIDRAPRARVHAMGWLHRAVHIWVFDPDGRVLLQKRAMSKDRHPGTWDSSASGHLDSGEDYLPAALREIGEELGVDGAGLSELAYCADTEQLDQEFVRVYCCEYDGALQINEGEISEIRWLPPGEISSWIETSPVCFAPAYRHLWEKYSESAIAWWSLQHG